MRKVRQIIDLVFQIRKRLGMIVKRKLRLGRRGRQLDHILVGGVAEQAKVDGAVV